MSDTNKIGNAEKPKKKPGMLPPGDSVHKNKVYLCVILFLYMCLVSNILCHVFIHFFFFHLGMSFFCCGKIHRP